MVRNSSQVVGLCNKAGRILLHAVDVASSEEDKARRARSPRRLSRLLSVARELVRVRVPDYNLRDTDLNLHTASQVDECLEDTADSLAKNLAAIQSQMNAMRDLEKDTKDRMRLALGDCHRALDSLAKVQVNPLYKSMVSLESLVHKSADLVGNMIGILESRDGNVLSIRSAKDAAQRALDVVKSLR